MNHNEFWRIIDEAREEAGGEIREPPLKRLCALDVPDLMLWKQIFDEYQRLSYKSLLWAAAYIIQGGCSDDAFDYFRAWLTAQGKLAFLNALKDPETLAELDFVPENTEFEDMIGIAAEAYFCKLKLPPAGREEYRRDYNAYNAELDKYPLPEEIKAAMAAEVVYHKDIDAEWDENPIALSALLPFLWVVFGWEEGYGGGIEDDE
ncbi:MAG: DUF4240 domain-containing protein [Synergistaceae bacterium]|jgi:hypothetical protein|nr:DUF4240 domain-containing protein [Synergistaceae bacterium]